MLRLLPRSPWSIVTLSAALCALSLPTWAQASELRVTVASPAPIPPNYAVVMTPMITSFDIVLHQPHQGALQNFIRSLSDTASANYHRYLSTTQFADAFGATNASVAAVTKYLDGFNLHVGVLSKGHTLLPVSGSTTNIASAFHSSVATVRRHDGALAAQFVSNATLPVSIAHDVAAVAGLSTVVPPHAMSLTDRARARVNAPTSCAGASDGANATSTTPNSLGGYTLAQQAQLYGLGVPWSQGFTGAGQTIGVYELGAYSPSNVATYASCYGLTPTITAINVDGGITGAYSDEATLDVEEAAGLAPGAAIEVYTAPNTNSGPLDAYQRMADDNTASIITTSWGTCESDPTGSAIGEQAIFEQMAAQGQTVIAAAGDSGSSDCKLVSNLNAVAVDDPASQPYVTGVGGLSVTSINPLTQSVWNDGVNSGGGASGGGVSQLWSRPWWQKAPGISSTASMRLVPDLAVMGDPSTGFVDYFGTTGSWSSIGGTSIGSPLVSAIVAVAAQSCGQSRLGFINPSLYQMASTGFVDVTSGSNDLFGVGQYSAGPGYDEASGLGSPNPSTFAQGLCAQKFNPLTSSFSAPTTATALGTSSAFSVKLHDAANQPIANSLISINASAQNGGVVIDNDHASVTGNGTAAYALSTDLNGTANFSIFASSPGPVHVSVSFESKTIYTSILNFVNPVAARTVTAPGRPTIVTLVALTASFRLSVQPPATSGGSPIRAYQYSLNGGTSWISFSSKTRTVTAVNLGRGKRYRVIVRAINARGPGVASAPFLVTTRN